MDAAIQNTTVVGCADSIQEESVVNDKRSPGSEWIRRTALKTKTGSMHTYLRDVTTRQVKQLVRSGNMRAGQKLDMAIDMHLIPRHDKHDTPNLTHSKPKKGTCKFERYISIQSVIEGARFILGMMPM